MNFVVGGDDSGKMGSAAEKREGGQIGFAVAAVGGGVDQPGGVRRAPDDVARPEVAVDSGGRFSGGFDVDRFDEGGIGGVEGAGVDGEFQVRQDSAFAIPGRDRK